MKIFFAIVVLAVLAWFVDASGFGFWKSEKAPAAWTQDILNRHPVAVYIEYGGLQYLLTDPQMVSTAIETFGKREYKYKVSLFGRRIYRHTTPKDKLYVQYEGGQQFQQLLQFAGGPDDVGQAVVDYLENLPSSSAPPAGWQLNAVPSGTDLVNVGDR